MKQDRQERSSNKAKTSSFYFLITSIFGTVFDWLFPRIQKKESAAIVRRQAQYALWSRQFGGLPQTRELVEENPPTAACTKEHVKYKGENPELSMEYV